MAEALVRSLLQIEKTKNHSEDIEKGKGKGKGEGKMEKYQCGPCGYIYDPEVGDPDNGIAPGTSFEELPEDWTCPICGVSKDMFEKM